MDLRTLTAMFGPSGHENEVRAALLTAARETGVETHIDRMGNVIAFKKGSESGYPHVCVSAHMDEVGFIVRNATDEGLLKIACVGGIDPRVVVSKRVLVGDKRLPGVIGAMAIHLQTAADRARVLTFDDLYIDIGAKDKDDALKDCPRGCYAIFVPEYDDFGDGLVCAKALDDRVGCMNALKLLNDRYPGDLTVAFVGQEEVGLRGATTAAFGISPDIAIILEGTTASDMGDMPDTQTVCCVGQGVAISFRDNASIAHRGLYRAMIRTAESSGACWQIKRGVTGGNDAGAYQRSASGVKTCVLSVPCRYIHGPSSVASYRDIDAQYALCKAFLENPTIEEE